MGYVYGLIVVGLFFLAMHYFTELDKKQKTIISATLLVVILGAIAYNSYSSKQQEQMLNVVLKYQQNKTVSCNGVDVNSTFYDLSTGTYTFIGKKDTPNYGEMISVSSCQ